MGKITKITDQKKNQNRVSIYVDDKFCTGLYKSDLLKLGLDIGLEVDEKYIVDLIRKDDIKKAMNAALSYLSYKARTEKEVYDKLITKEYPADIAQIAVDEIVKLKYIDDLQYARDYIEFRIKNKGQRTIKFELIKKGISEFIIEDIFEEYEADYIYANALLIGMKKFNTFDANLDRRKMNDRLFRFMAGKGYDYDIVKRVVREVMPSSDSSDEYYG